MCIRDRSLKATAWTDYYKGIKASNQKVIWRLIGEDGEYTTSTDEASISSSGRVSAKNVTENTDITVVAISAEKEGANDSIVLTIRPKQTCTLTATFENWDSETYTGTVTVPINLDEINADDLRDHLDVLAYISIPNDPADGDPAESVKDAVIWSTSSKSIVSIDSESGALKANKAGKVTLTAKYVKEISGKKTTFTTKITLVLVNAVKEIEIAPRVKEQKLYAGKTLALRADTNPEATNKRVKWSLVGEYDDDYAVINANSGVITAKRTVKSWCQVTVQAEALDGYECESATFTVDIYPLATEVKPTLNGVSVSMTDHGSMTVKEEAVLGIEKPDNGADPEIKWTSSRTSVATIKWDKDNEVYVLVAKGKGTATILSLIHI